MNDFLPELMTCCVERRCAAAFAAIAAIAAIVNTCLQTVTAIFNMVSRAVQGKEINHLASGNFVRF